VGWFGEEPAGRQEENILTLSESQTPSRQLFLVCHFIKLQKKFTFAVTIPHNGRSEVSKCKEIHKYASLFNCRD
jgi:hypothetical protein